MKPPCSEEKELNSVHCSNTSLIEWYISVLLAAYIFFDILSSFDDTPVQNILNSCL